MKLVREHINEKFTDESDPIKDMGIGLQHQTKKWIEYINSTSGARHVNKIDTYFILNNDDGTIDVGKPFEVISSKDFHSEIDAIVIRGDTMKQFPSFIKINKCYGNCYLNVSIIESLRGCPRIVYGDFILNADPELKNLDYFPREIHGSVYVDRIHYDKLLELKVKRKCKIYGSTNQW